MSNSFTVSKEEHENVINLMIRYQDFIKDVGHLSAETMPIVVNVLKECKEIDDEQKSKQGIA